MKARESFRYIAAVKSRGTRTGANDDEVPPVPIPNTEVKLVRAEDTWRETAWENRSVPVQEENASCVLFFCLLFFITPFIKPHQGEIFGGILLSRSLICRIKTVQMHKALIFHQFLFTNQKLCDIITS